MQDDQKSAPLRADARRNREQIIDAARTLFVRVGADVPMEQIARAAGVGVGTLYRRFPDRDELISAVLLDNYARLVELARAAEEDRTDPMAALFTFLRSARGLRVSSMLTALSAIDGRTGELPGVAEQRVEVTAVVSTLLRRAQEQGSMRADIGIGDVVLAFGAVSRLVPPIGDDLGEMVFDRLFTLMTEGLRTPGGPLPGHPVEPSDVEELRSRGGVAGLGKPGPSDRIR
ncbi:TetR/AcrR family transcriptional regulator [Pseudonocardia ailaonensis]|uniref:TetR/AcrR family transcriptional regulator n=1 Tax=Pseudonocardia ailaonensis TaxID=367279 RepID=A0ABN2MI86_9PSEU